MKPSGVRPQPTMVSVIFCGQYMLAARNWNTPTLPIRNMITPVRFIARIAVGSSSRTNSLRPTIRAVDHRVAAGRGRGLGGREQAAVEAAEDDHRHAERGQRALRLAQHPAALEPAAARQLEP